MTYRRLSSLKLAAFRQRLYYLHLSCRRLNLTLLRTILLPHVNHVTDYRIVLLTFSQIIFQGIDDLLGLSGTSTGGGEMTMSDFMLNNTSSSLATLSTTSDNARNNGLAGMCG